jgi:AsmA protein
MNRSLKIMLIAIAVLLSVFIILSFAVKSYLTDERVRTLVLENAERALGREVRLGDIKIGLFRGIVVRDMEVMEKGSAQTFVRATDFILRYQLIPLLKKKLIIDEISLNDSEIYLKKNADGSFNFSDIAKAEKISDEKEKKKSSGLPLSMDIRKISVRNSKINYTEPAGKLKRADLLLNAEMDLAETSRGLLSSTGELEIILAEAWLRDRQQPLKSVNTAFKYKVDADIKSGMITVHSIGGDIMAAPFTVQGIIGSPEEPVLSLDIKLPNINLADLRGLTSQLVPDALAADGSLMLILNIKKPGEESPLIFSGDMTINGLSFNYKGFRPVFNGSINLTPEIIRLQNLRLHAGQNSADITGSVKNYMKYPDIHVALKSNSLSLDELFPAAAQPEKPQTAPEKSSSSKQEPEPMDLKLRMAASLDIGKTSFRGVQISNLRSSLELKENKLRIATLKGNTLSGSFAFSSIIDLARRGTGYDVDLNLDGVKLEEVVSAFAPKAKGKLFGTLAGKAAISGAGTVPDNIKKNLKGKGNFSVKDGVIKNAELGEGLLAFLGLQELREIPIQKAEGNFKIGGRTVELTTLISSKDLVLNQKGTIGMDEELDLDVLAKISERLSPKLLTQSGISRFLSEEKGWTSIPLKIGGTLSKPSYAIDTRAVGKKAGESIQKRIGEELFKSLQKDREEPSGTEQKKRSAPEDLIRDLFR